MLAVTPRLPDCPVPPIVPLVCVSVNQLAAGATVVFHVSGHTQLPVPVNMTVRATGLADAPCTALKESALDEGGDRVQGGCISRLTMMVCGLPGAAFAFGIHAIERDLSHIIARGQWRSIHIDGNLSRLSWSNGAT